jgi:hypothetical protein
LADKVASNDAKDIPLRQYDGFDISSIQFPKNQREGFTWIEHDMLQPFPEKFHRMYDIINIRFMALAFRKKDYTTATENIIKLLSKRSQTRIATPSVIIISFTTKG